MKISTKKAIIIFIGIVLIYGVVYWYVVDGRKKSAKYGDKTISFLIDERVKSNYGERMRLIADVYQSTVNEMEDNFIKEEERIIREARDALVEEGYIKKEEEQQMTDEEVILLLEKILINTKNETEKEQ